MKFFDTYVTKALLSRMNMGEKSFEAHKILGFDTKEKENTLYIYVLDKSVSMEFQIGLKDWLLNWKF